MNPVLGYWKQTNPLYLATTAFLTRAYNADRLRWMLKDVGDRELWSTRIEPKLGRWSDAPAPRRI